MMHWMMLDFVTDCVCYLLWKPAAVKIYLRFGVRYCVYYMHT